MGTLEALKSEVANLLEEPEKSMNSRAMMLTKAKLLTSAGHGRKAIARPSDLSNLLLGLLGGGAATQVAATVMRARYLESMGVTSSRMGTAEALRMSREAPPINIFDQVPKGRWPRDSNGHLLGDILDVLFADCGLSIHCTDTGLPIDSVELTVTRNASDGIVAARINFAEQAPLDPAPDGGLTFGREWRVHYHGYDPELAAAAANARTIAEFEEQIYLHPHDNGRLLQGLDPEHRSRSSRTITQTVFIDRWRSMEKLREILIQVEG